MSHNTLLIVDTVIIFLILLIDISGMTWRR
jgi:hypothetical protein